MLTKMELDRVEYSPVPPHPLPIEDIPLRVLTAIRRIIRGVDINSRRLEDEYGVTTPQLVALRAVSEAGSITPGALAERVHLSASTMIGILDRLEEKDLVQRRRDREDRRRMNVTTTEKGKRMIAAAPLPLQHTLAERLQGLSDLERLAIANALERVVDLMEVRSLEASPVLDHGPLIRTPKPPLT